MLTGWGAGMARGTSHLSCPWSLLPSQRGIQRAALKNSHFGQARRGRGWDVTQCLAGLPHSTLCKHRGFARASPLQQTPGAPQSMGLCLALLLHHKSRGGTGCQDCTGGAKPRLNRLSLNHPKSGQVSGRSEQHHPQEAAGRWQVPARPRGVNLHAGDLPVKLQLWAPRILIWAVGLMQLRAVSSSTLIQERLGGGYFLLGGDAMSPGFASHTKQLHHHLGFFSLVWLKPPPEHCTPRGELSAAAFSGRRSWELFGFHFRGSAAAAAAMLREDGNCSVPHRGPTAEPPTLPIPEAGSHNAPKICMIRGFPCWQQQVFARGKQAAVGWLGLGFSGGRGSWWKHGKGSCQADLF